MLTPEDKDLLVKKGISEQQIAEQLACFEKGFPFLKLDAAASVEKGIMAPAENEMKNYLEAWDTYKEGEKTIVKFVPSTKCSSSGVRTPSAYRWNFNNPFGNAP